MLEEQKEGLFRKPKKKKVLKGTETRKEEKDSVFTDFVYYTKGKGLCFTDLTNYDPGQEIGKRFVFYRSHKLCQRHR